MYRIHLVSTGERSRYWPAAMPHIISMADNSSGKFDPMDIVSRIAGDEWQLWVILKDEEIVASVVTAIVDYPRRRICEGLGCAGDGARQWVHLIAEIEAWAKTQGCTLMQPIARLGWSALFKPLGYKSTHLMMEKDL